MDRFSEENFLLYRLEGEVLLWEWVDSVELVVDWVDRVHRLVDGLHNTKVLVNRMKRTKLHRLDLMKFLVDGLNSTELHWLDLMEFLMNRLQLRMGDTQHVVVDRDNVVDPLEGTVCGVCGVDHLEWKLLSGNIH